MASVKKSMKVLQDWRQVQEEEKPLAQIIKEQKRSKSLSEKAAAQYQEITTEQKNQKEIKKKNKKAPREVTTDKPVTRFRKINMPFKVRSQLKRDPRFDNLSGSFNQDLFHKSYKFLEKQLQADIENFNSILQKLTQDQNGDNEEEIQGIEIQIRKLKQQQSQLSNFKLEQGVKKKIKAEEEEAIKQGKKPFFLKKNILKKTILKQKFLDLEKKGKLDKYITRKKQKIDSKSIKEKNSLVNQQKFIKQLKDDFLIKVFKNIALNNLSQTYFKIQNSNRIKFADFYKISSFLSGFYQNLMIYLLVLQYFTQYLLFSLDKGQKEQ